MQAPTELTLAHHLEHIPLLFEYLTRRFLFTTKVHGCYDGRCHHLGIAHLTLWVFLMLQRFQKIGSVQFGYS